MDAQSVREALFEVIDPEVGINVVDLGLVHEIHLEDGAVHVVMTMTTPACPLGPYLSEEVELAIRRRFPDVREVGVELAWEPRWDPSKISEEGRRQLGR